MDCNVSTINFTRVGFMEISGLESGCHQVDDMAENLEISSSDTDDENEDLDKCDVLAVTTCVCVLLVVSGLHTRD